jgi:hypothetical protein
MWPLVRKPIIPVSRPLIVWHTERPKMEKDDDPGYRSFPGIEFSLTEAKKLAPAVRPPILQTHLNAEVLASYKADILDLVDFRRRLIQAPSSTE